MPRKSKKLVEFLVPTPAATVADASSPDPAVAESTIPTSANKGRNAAS